jgi:hypothetical protein
MFGDDGRDQRTYHVLGDGEYAYIMQPVTFARRDGRRVLGTPVAPTTLDAVVFCEKCGKRNEVTNS